MMLYGAWHGAGALSGLCLEVQVQHAGYGRCRHGTLPKKLAAFSNSVNQRWEPADALIWSLHLELHGTYPTGAHKCQAQVHEHFSKCQCVSR